MVTMVSSMIEFKKPNIIKRVYARFRLFNLIKGYSTSFKVSKQIHRIMYSGEFVIKGEDAHCIILKHISTNDKFRLWNANKYYAWLNKCERVNTYESVWYGEMPDSWTMLKFKQWYNKQDIESGNSLVNHTKILDSIPFHTVKRYVTNKIMEK